MERELDLLRQILLLCEREGHPDKILDWTELHESGYSDALIHYHLLLLEDVNYVVLNVTETTQSDYYDVVRMTSQGHDYLDSIRDPAIWSKTKKSLAVAGESATLAMVQAVAIALLKGSLAKSGINI